jgi:hypothetical protein
MYKELASHMSSPLLLLPLVAMFVFLAVFVVMVAHTLTRSRADVKAWASLPLVVEERDERR